MRYCDMVDEYYSWLMDIIQIKELHRKGFSKALGMLYSREFSWFVHNDENRAVDGLYLREEFSYEYEYPVDFWYGYLPDYCSVLEMMVALAKRCESEIMFDPDEGDRTGKWFWIMFDNLGLNQCPDSNYDDDYANEIVDIFLARKYEDNGRGNIFTINDPRIKLKRTELWYQMQYFIDENY